MIRTSQRRIQTRFILVAVGLAAIAAFFVALGIDSKLRRPTVTSEPVLTEPNDVERAAAVGSGATITSSAYGTEERSAGAPATTVPAVVTTLPTAAAPTATPTATIAEPANPAPTAVSSEVHDAAAEAPRFTAARLDAGWGIGFRTESPPWAASAMTSNPEAGAGDFKTEAPSWAASAMTSNPEAGAGPFKTERNIPAGPIHMGVPGQR